MAVFECRCCGGKLTLVPGKLTAECEYCGLIQTIVDPENENKSRLYRIANTNLRKHEFSSAEGRFRRILEEYPEEAEAYWGLVLCTFGIEYVDDPATGRKVPTCHRTSYESVLKDPNYLNACKYADPEQLELYKKEAAEIERIRLGFLEIINKEEPYHIFISYKESDENDNRTNDSVIAHDIYDALVERGYRVFFSRVTLESHAGEKYEPLIFAALNTAKVMLVVGTKYEYFNAPWVRNEWSRYQDIAQRDRSKKMITCHLGIDKADMPRELQVFQDMDMGLPGALEDLIHGIETLVPIEIENANPTSSNMLKRAEIALSGHQWAQAQEYADKVLDIDPQCAQAYLIKAMAENHCADHKSLKESYVSGKIQNSRALERARQYAGQEIACWLDEAEADRNMYIDRENRATYADKDITERVAMQIKETLQTQTGQEIQEIRSRLDELGSIRKSKEDFSSAFSFLSFTEDSWFVCAFGGLTTVAAGVLGLCKGNTDILAALCVALGIIGFSNDALFPAIVMLAVMVATYFLSEIWIGWSLIGMLFGLVFAVLVYLHHRSASKADHQFFSADARIEKKIGELRTVLLPEVERTLLADYRRDYYREDPKVKDFDAHKGAEKIITDIICLLDTGTFPSSDGNDKK